MIKDEGFWGRAAARQSQEIKALNENIRILGDRNKKLKSAVNLSKNIINHYKTDRSYKSKMERYEKALKEIMPCESFKTGNCRSCYSFNCNYREAQKAFKHEEVMNSEK